MAPTTRRSFLHGAAAQTSLMALSACHDGSADAAPAVSGKKLSRGTDRMPVLFVGHGSPAHTLSENRWTLAFQSLGRSVPRPRAILCVSAHWLTAGTQLTAMAQPRTIHDFGGFAPALYELQYPAPGSPDLATRVRSLLQQQQATLDEQWGLDHGAWTVLRWMFPEANVPVVQLSLNHQLSMAGHLELARTLHELRDDRVLIVGSGNVTHNLRDAFTRMRSNDTNTPAWAQRFDDHIAKLLTNHDTQKLRDLWPNGPDARAAHPSVEHFLPLLYTFGVATKDDEVAFPVEGFDAGSLSMRAVRFG